MVNKDEKYYEIAREKLKYLDFIHGDGISISPDFLPDSFKYLTNDKMPRHEAVIKAAEIELENVIKKQSPHSFDLALELIAKLIEDGFSLPASLSGWTALALRSQAGWSSIPKNKRIKRPRQHGKAKNQNTLRNDIIVGAIKALHKAGLTIGHNHATKRNIPQFSAISIVKKVLSERRMPLSYKALESIFYNSNPPKN
ncbi:hypothetical protein K1X76_08705 [bacterium]|nr:hypothetical protein [bacterium]